MNNIDPVTGRRREIQKLINIIPKSLRLRFNPRRYAIENFVHEKSLYIKKGSIVLDAGAGPCPYKSMFNHCKYEATDFVENGIVDFICSLEKIPRRSNTYDVVLLTEVLEHVEDPIKVLKEVRRVLKEKGQLLITVPQAWMVHQKPHNYFYFTNYGLELILKKSGFRKFVVRPMGGYFWFLADVIRFNSILDQLGKYKIIYYPLKIIEYPITKIIVPLILFYLDFLDSKKDWTMGYTAEAIK